MNKRRISPSIKTLNGLVEKKLLKKDRKNLLDTPAAMGLRQLEKDDLTPQGSGSRHWCQWRCWKSGPQPFVEARLYGGRKHWQTRSI